jgi:hypothetical protein
VGARGTEFGCSAMPLGDLAADTRRGDPQPGNGEELTTPGAAGAIRHGTAMGRPQGGKNPPNPGT